MAQFMGDTAPFNNMRSICLWAEALGFKAVQIPTWDPRCIDLQKAAELRYGKRLTAEKELEKANAELEKVQKQGRSPRIYVQVNTGEEEQKAGVLPAEADAFIAACRTVYRLEPEGLMCIPPLGEPPGPHFALLAKIAARNGLSKLSMGMSDDFETAIAFGATSVRVGSAVFGPRA